MSGRAGGWHAGCDAAPHHLIHNRFEGSAGTGHAFSNHQINVRVKGYRDAHTFSVQPPSVDVKTSAAQHEAGGEVFAEDAAEGSFVAGGVAFQLGDGGGAGDAASGDSERGGGDVADGVSGAAAE